MHIAQFHVETFQAHQLVGDLLTQRPHRGVFDVAEKMLDSDFFGLLGTDFRRNMLKSLCRWRSVVMNLFDGSGDRMLK